VLQVAAAEVNSKTFFLLIPRLKVSPEPALIAGQNGRRRRRRKLRFLQSQGREKRMKKIKQNDSL
jgi:hypothetical protein